MVHVVVDRQLLRSVQRDPRSLKCAVAALHFVMLACEDFLLENTCAPRLFNAGNLEDLRRIQIPIRATTHERNATHGNFIHRHGRVGG